MKKQWYVVALLVAGAGTDVLACGDKFLVVSRGTRFQRPPIARPAASILLYANPATGLPSALSNVAFESTLRKAGYQPTSVTTAAELESALREKEWDLIVADLAEGQAIRARLQGRAGSPLVLPVLYNASRKELAEARKEYRLLLRAPTKAEAFLEVIDDAVVLKQKQSKSEK
ncbi:MAG TPA: hypothetical protein VNA04_04180 [Thermoanaerobaculia bacterium]|nr:hypothetical protein [Thermoanaerobaculia bacterium]